MSNTSLGAFIGDEHPSFGELLNNFTQKMIGDFALIGHLTNRRISTRRAFRQVKKRLDRVFTCPEKHHNSIVLKVIGT
jgi:hypothetical protein